MAIFQIIRQRPLLIAVLVCVTCGSLSAEGKLPPGKGVLLPIRDHTGSPEAVLMLEDSLREVATLDRLPAETDALRAHLRRLRIRDLNTASTDALQLLTAEIQAAWYVTFSIHQVVASPVPQLTLSASIYVPGNEELHWAGFESLSSLDQRRWLELRELDQLESLVRFGVERLWQSAAGNSDSRKRTKTRVALDDWTYLREALPMDSSARVALVPFDSVSRRNPSGSAAEVTAAATALLHESNVTLVHPRLVNRLQLEVRQLSRGSVDEALRDTLSSQLGVKWIFTGTVENYDFDSGLSPDPRVEISGRLIDSASGRILWLGGREIRGRYAEGFFEAGIRNTPGQLASDMMQAFVMSFSSSKIPNRRRSKD